MFGFFKKKKRYDVVVKVSDMPVSHTNTHDVLADIGMLIDPHWEHFTTSNDYHTWESFGFKNYKFMAYNSWVSDNGEMLRGSNHTVGELEIIRDEIKEYFKPDGVFYMKRNANFFEQPPAPMDYDCRTFNY
jgi:hypothetical protein